MYLSSGNSASLLQWIDSMGGFWLKPACLRGGYNLASLSALGRATG